MALELMHELGFEGSYGKTRQIGESSLFRIDLEAPEAQVGLLAVQIACAYLSARTTRQTFDLQTERERLRLSFALRCLGPSTQAIADAARRRGIPVR
ncbi:hypothetical protein B1A_20491, partial [mine drainage metagenome]